MLSHTFGFSSTSRFATVSPLIGHLITIQSLLSLNKLGLVGQMGRFEKLNLRKPYLCLGAIDVVYWYSIPFLFLLVKYCPRWVICVHYSFRECSSGIDWSREHTAQRLAVLYSTSAINNMNLYGSLRISEPKTLRATKTTLNGRKSSRRLVVKSVKHMLVNDCTDVVRTCTVRLGPLSDKAVQHTLRKFWNALKIALRVLIYNITLPQHRKFGCAFSRLALCTVVAC